jgi:RNA polymerase sigma factor (sigma-70 family)
METLSYVAAFASQVTRDNAAATERWRAIYERARPSLVRALAACAGTYEGVEDAVQDAFVRALGRDPDDLAAVEGWLFVVALNRFRRSRRVFRVPWARSGERPSELDAAMLRLDVVRALMRLSQRERELLVGKYYVGLSQVELAHLMNMRRGSVSAAVSRAAARFRELEGG